MRLLTASLLALTLAAQARPADTDEPKGKTHALTEKNGGETLKLKKGDTITLTLPSNPTTGFRWQVVRVNPELVALDGKPSYKPAAKGLIGGGGRQTFTFKAADVGWSQLELYYWRGFEKGKNPPAKKFSLTVEAEK
jgi:inhibitor of cysteine peptidase